MSITHFVYLLFSFQRPNLPNFRPSRSRDRVSTSAPGNRQEKFRRIFQPVFSFARRSFASFRPARALYLTTPRLPVNLKNLLPVDFFYGCGSAANEALFSRWAGGV